MTDLALNYSGVVLNQNTTTTPFAWRSKGGGWIYQTFTLPADYRRGHVTGEIATPDISGFQICLAIDPGDAALAALNFTLDYRNGATWESLASGVATGSHADGDRVWFDVLLRDTIPVTAAMLTGLMRIGVEIVSQSGVSQAWYVSPSPLRVSNGVAEQAYQADGATPLLGLGTTAAIGFRLLALVADAGTNFLGNEYRSTVIQSSSGNISTTSGLNPVTGSGGATSIFMSPPLPSRFAVVNAYFNVQSSNEPVVIDSVLVDPITPNMAFNVYYSNDDSTTNAHMTESDWEGKLWSRVPQVYQCTQRQQYVFPAPIQAKYVQLEFTNLQGRQYTPGPFQLPATYKKFPTWVAHYFVGLLESPSFITSQVNVEYDALSFAYNYYLDDLNQEPAKPTLPPTAMAQQLTNYFNTQPVGVDSATLNQIDLTMSRFTRPPTSTVDTSSSLGSFVSSLTGITQVAEANLAPSLAYTIVSSLNREGIIFEQSLPVMYFFLTCRHGYKELAADFEYNRAYFAGVNEVAFMRNDYTAIDDTPMYIESGGDIQNITTLDFANQNNVWLTY